MGNNKIYIISNESIQEESKKYFCDNLDLKSIPEGLDKNFDVSVIARRSKSTRYHSINNINIQVAKNLLIFIKLIFASLKNKDKAKYLIISISPYTFIACIILYLSKIRPLVYLRSNGYQEYKSIFGFVGVPIYHFMFFITSITSNLISCRKHILRKKNGKIISPSQLSDQWFKHHDEVQQDKIKLLYVGRLKVEKGIFSFLKIFDNLNDKAQLTIVTAQKDHFKIEGKKNINCLGSQTENSLIKVYDKHNIFILPSFTEAHPQVLDEALSLLRPVIVFNEIEHVKRDREGVFVCRRSAQDLNQKMDYIMNNYELIQMKIKKNKLPNKKTFLIELENLINLSSNKERWPSG